MKQSIKLLPEDMSGFYSMPTFPSTFLSWTPEVYSETIVALSRAWGHPPHGVSESWSHRLYSKPFEPPF